MSRQTNYDEPTDFSAIRSVVSPQRSASVSATRPRSRDHAGGSQFVPQNAINTKPLTQDSPGGNLNRWSKSTASSTVSHTHKRSESFSRRMSFGGGQNSFLDTSSPPRKLQKSRPSTTNSPSSQLALTRTPFDSSSITLPPIDTLPSLQTSVSNTPLPGLGIPSPSTAEILSAAARSVDYFGKAWEDSSVGPQDFAHRRSPSTSRSTKLGPSPILGPGAAAENGVGRYRLGEGDNRPRSRGHSRNRSQGGKGSTASASSNRSSKQPSQKAMLSKALQKANTAVLLDNAQNFEGAMQAYSEACTLLQQVMQRSSGDEDRRKLEAIRNTYTSRISELRKIAPELIRSDGKALPARPRSGGYRAEDAPSQDEEEDAPIMETATITRIVNDRSYTPESQQNRSIQPSQLPQRRESLLSSTFDSLQYRPKTAQDQYTGRSYSKSPMRERISEMNSTLAPPMDSLYMPPPLSPRRPSSPMSHGRSNSNHERQKSSDLSNSNLSGVQPKKTHARNVSNESMSWLDTIDESGGSTASSVHSRTSSMGVRRKHIRAPSGATEAEFDAALDAAVEAAYDDGFEPMDATPPARYDYDDDDDDDDEIVANVRRRVELAKERVRQSEREAAIQSARDRERKRLLQRQEEQKLNSPSGEYDGNESEEEERMLEEMTRGYVMEDFEFGLQSKSALPRESDSSGFSGRTWNSSIGSNPTTAGTTLSTVAETSSNSVPQIPTIQSKTQPPLNSPPSQALPPPPNVVSQPPLSISNSQGVRSRRLSGQNAKQLKIETTTKASAIAAPLTQPPPMPPPQLTMDAVQPKTAGLLQQRQTLPETLSRSAGPQPARKASSPIPGPSPSEIILPPTPTLTQTITNESETPRSGSPGRAQSRSGLRKNFSSSSLKNMKGRNLSVSNIDDGSDVSPNTPLSSQFNPREMSGRLPAMPTLPTPIAIAFKEKQNGLATGGMYLFDSDIHTPDSPGSPSTNPLAGSGPIPLEPCPTEYLLRPFWLMRALYQTIAHPRGGYLSTKLFIPRDVWRVKGVKIKNVEDKIANCDFLTAALMKLAQVDTFDADAVLEEMQSLEGVLEQVQATLTKKLGNEVGTQGAGGMFKDGGDAEISTLASKAGSVSSKSSTFSWRRLRSKNSGVGLSNSYANKTPADGPKESLSMSTLPMTMTSVSKVRFAKRDVSQVQFSGPNAHYMSALARLFDAAQTLDQIARQVEDPGLRHADKTQVGLELCTRHAAEFFGFYICRFVLTDIGMLLDKFIKRGSEWVLV